jgi:hypothetical protein
MKTNLPASQKKATRILKNYHQRDKSIGLKQGSSILWLMSKPGFILKIVKWSRAKFWGVI